MIQAYAPANKNLLLSREDAGSDEGSDEVRSPVRLMLFEFPCKIPEGVQGTYKKNRHCGVFLRWLVLGWSLVSLRIGPSLSYQFTLLYCALYCTRVFMRDQNAKLILYASRTELNFDNGLQMLHGVLTGGGKSIPEMFTPSERADRYCLRMFVCVCVCLCEKGATQY